MIKNPLVSVLILTYNHEKYIAQSINSALMQKTNFEFEIIIGEDHSADQTREIVKNYCSKYPNIIIGIFQEKNIGAKNNSKSIRLLAKGKYIAFLEGDDFWIDPFKLQKQVNFLETHPSYSICFHRAKMVNQFGQEIGKSWPKRIWNKQTTSLSDLLHTNYISTQTVVYRNKLFDENILEQLGKDLYFGDWIFNILNAEKGLIFFINNEMAAYRVTKEGATLSTHNLKRIKDVIIFCERLKKYFKNNEYKRILDKTISQYLLQKTLYIAESKYKNEAKGLFFKNSHLSKLRPDNIGEILSVFLLIYTPRLFKLLKYIFQKKIHRSQSKL